ncbi:protein phosphatase CheZ [Methylobacterium durans]|uniref:Chemotaxis protein n=1 Tax=Methylobacterium durans TaxID=2202825 RepID=A0A2U8W4K9_9HYPH|nr:protein phosphatase CheZ [Methylobacterium durans]AWN41045.1 chemotaxis protein [Methylobacterium durans]
MLFARKPRETAPERTQPAVIHELVEIAEYISHLRQEIAALRANEITRDRIPMAHEELGNVLEATAGATNRIMATAEEMLSLPDDAEYRANVEGKIYEIFEACAFQDITGQRISKVVEALRQLELRLARFANAVKARDESAIDPTEAERRGRAERLLLNGPQIGGPATSQDDIDALFA